MGWRHALRAIAALVATLSLPIVAHAVPVTWEARGCVDSSTLDVLFFETFMPELVGIAAGDPLVLRIRFDTDAERFVRNQFTASFDATSLIMTLEVPRLGTHVFTIDTSVPDGRHSLIGIVDDPVRDGIQFQHQYLTPDGVSLFTILAAFFTADTSVIDGLRLLPMTPDPRLGIGIEQVLSIKADPAELGELSGIFTSLVRVPEPGSLALFALGLCILAATMGTKTPRCR